MANKTKCQNCTSEKPKEAGENVVFSAASYERHETRHERREKRLVLALVIALIIVFLSNAIWLYSWCQYDYTSEEVAYTQDGQGTNIIGNENEVNNGAKTNSKETNTP